MWTQLTEQDDSYVLTDRSLLVYSFPEMVLDPINRTHVDQVRDFWGAGAYMITICLVVGTGMLPSLRGLTTGIGMHSFYAADYLWQSGVSPCQCPYGAGFC